MKIAVFEIEDWEKDSFSQLLAEHEVMFVHEPLTMENAAVYADADIVSVFIYSHLSSAVMAVLPKLKMIATRSTGFDHIDIKTACARGVVVSNVPTYGEATVAEHVFALLLTISHHMYEAIDRTRRGSFSQDGLQGFDLAGKTLGIVGMGNIGQHTARIAKGFGMNVVAYDVAPDTAIVAALGFSYESFDRVLELSDILSVHVPGNASTHHMISADAFSRMKDGSVLINTARGSVVDVEALVEALTSGKLKAAGLDVLPGEPAIKEEAELLRVIRRQKQDIKTLLMDHVLLRMENVFITPHSAFNTREAVLRILATTTQNITAFARGGPQNSVTA